MKVIRESYRAGESWPFFVTLERGEEIRGYFRVDYDALLELANEMEQEPGPVCGVCMGRSANRIREALGVSYG